MATRAKDVDYDEEDSGPNDKLTEGARAILQRLDSQALEQVRKKSQIEERWIKNLRAYWGKYDSAVDQTLTDAAALEGLRPADAAQDERLGRAPVRSPVPDRREELGHPADAGARARQGREASSEGRREVGFETPM
jgi:hypothetical protein